MTDKNDRKCIAQAVSKAKVITNLASLCSVSSNIRMLRNSLRTCGSLKDFADNLNPSTAHLSMSEHS